MLMAKAYLSKGGTNNLALSSICGLIAFGAAALYFRER